jgi:hypothetical protein
MRMHRTLCGLLRVHVLLLAAAAGAAQARFVLPDGANAHPQYVGTPPKKSDVIFSSRFKRPNAAEAARSFGATRIEWIYPIDKDFAAQLLEVAPVLGGTINANGPLPDDDGYARDFDGRIIVSPWMKAWNGRWITTQHPDVRQHHLERIKSFADLGAQTIQVDDPLMQMSPALYQAGDFSEAALAGFPRFLASYPSKQRVSDAGLANFSGSYRDWLKARHGVKNSEDYVRRFRTFPSTSLWLLYTRRSIERYYAALRSEMAALPGRRLSLSMNLGLTEPDENNRLFFLSSFADYALAETGIKDRVEIRMSVATLRSLGLGHVPSIMPLGKDENRTAIATFYALGSQPLVPWDTYLGTVEPGRPDRFFAAPRDYADLYAFARSSAGLLDGTESTPVVGLVIPTHKYDSKAVRSLVEDFDRRNVPFAFVLVGGHERKFPLDIDRARRFMALVMTNPRTDYAPEDIERLAAAGPELLEARDLDAPKRGSMQPFLLAPGAENVRLLPRGFPGRSDRLVVHVVDESARADGRTCRRRLGVRRSMRGASVGAAVWRAPGAASRDLPVDVADEHVFVSLDDCTTWGILELRLQH